MNWEVYAEKNIQHNMVPYFSTFFFELYFHSDISTFKHSEYSFTRPTVQTILLNLSLRTQDIKQKSWEHALFDLCLQRGGH